MSGDNICDTETYTTAYGTKGRCNVPCSNLIGGGDKDNFQNAQCKLFCPDCYTYQFTKADRDTTILPTFPYETLENTTTAQFHPSYGIQLTVGEIVGIVLASAIIAIFLWNILLILTYKSSKRFQKSLDRWLALLGRTQRNPGGPAEPDALLEEGRNVEAPVNLATVRAVSEIPPHSLQPDPEPPRRPTEREEKAPLLHPAQQQPHAQPSAPDLETMQSAQLDQGAVQVEQPFDLPEIHQAEERPTKSTQTTHPFPIQEATQPTRNRYTQTTSASAQSGSSKTGAVPESDEETEIKVPHGSQDLTNDTAPLDEGDEGARPSAEADVDGSFGKAFTDKNVGQRKEERPLSSDRISPDLHSGSSRDSLWGKNKLKEGGHSGANALEEVSQDLKLAGEPSAAYSDSFLDNHLRGNDEPNIVIPDQATDQPKRKDCTDSFLADQLGQYGDSDQVFPHQNGEMSASMDSNSGESLRDGSLGSNPTEMQQVSEEAKHNDLTMNSEDFLH